MPWDSGISRSPQGATATYASYKHSVYLNLAGPSLRRPHNPLAVGHASKHALFIMIQQRRGRLGCASTRTATVQATLPNSHIFPFGSQADQKTVQSIFAAMVSIATK